LYNNFEGLHHTTKALLTCSMFEKEKPEETIPAMEVEDNYEGESIMASVAEKKRNKKAAKKSAGKKSQSAGLPSGKLTREKLQKLPRPDLQKLCFRAGMDEEGSRTAVYNTPKKQLIAALLGEVKLFGKGAAKSTPKAAKKSVKKAAKKSTKKAAKKIARRKKSQK